MEYLLCIVLGLVLGICLDESIRMLKKAKVADSELFKPETVYEVEHSLDSVIQIKASTNGKRWRYHVSYRDMKRAPKHAKAFGFSFERSQPSDKTAVERARLMHGGLPLERLTE